MINQNIKPQWQQLFNQEQAKPYFIELNQVISQQRAKGEVIFPAQNDIFNAFCYQDIKDTKVVILGQDPYHGEDQAHGLAFSVQPGIKVPPSLVNIYKELVNEFADFNKPSHGCLTQWAEKGVLLLNTVLTVKQAQAHSHAKLGWETFTDAVIKHINQESSGCVFLLWGAHAQKKGKNINTEKHFVLNGPHPSPLSAYRGFFGCQHFSKTNQWLQSKNMTPINWQLPEQA
ncbi:uracil-DNA glycosylase [Colwellia sp. BRX8-4]|uniref:uracil-DNA glycosylase n=1 Tax=Colwellia sp. BRX8-4 TaxID=2759836 RepID=UPI0015F6C216|nr:uracil-DNA glycosylase [Colwellia sp. BRX8-4]MBA6364930.1 uracil-DNA glycosylase [Colwellia sp. BRX8-8]MBA6370162.1 uracil-DNA glycosylase [Colwellia sp. BRX8-4]|tara:strand:- start:1739 stop:2428 length:690 start_codon:yes stop_codon:yes gene_type:complete